MLRVLIGDLPHLQADVLATLVDAEPDMVVVGRGVLPLGLAESLETFVPDVVVISRPLSRRDAESLVVLATWPEVGVIAIDETSETIARMAIIPDDESWHKQVIASIRTAAPRYDARHRLDPSTD